MSTQFNCQKHFYFKLFSLIVKNISISNYSVYLNNSNSANFVYTLLNVKTVQYITIHFSISTVLLSKTVSFQTMLVLFDP